MNRQEYYAQLNEYLNLIIKIMNKGKIGRDKAIQFEAKLNEWYGVFICIYDRGGK